MNHSCDPTTISVDPIDEENGGSYGTEALRDIVPGEELTADYDLFEWDNRDKVSLRSLCMVSSLSIVSSHYLLLMIRGLINVDVAPHCVVDLHMDSSF
jgi:hypothetical protein